MSSWGYFTISNEQMHYLDTYNVFFSYLGSMDDCCNSCRLQRYAQSITNAAAICAAMGLDENWQNSIFPGLMAR